CSSSASSPGRTRRRTSRRRSSWTGAATSRAGGAVKRQWLKPEFASKLTCLSESDGHVTQLETLIEAIPKYQPGADLAVLERAYASREERQAENFRKMLIAMARDLRVIMIKLADRLHNMRTLHFLPSEKARKIAQETLDIYAPLAHRLGMANVKAELEDLALRTLHSEAYVDLQRRVAKRRLEREADINHVITIIE